MEFKRETIELTPELAKEYLAKRHPILQRKYEPNYAEQLSRNITAGRWNNSLHGADPMMFSETGYLINAQHRCGAVVIANKPIIIDVIYDVPEEMFQFVDGGKPRSLRQFVDSKHSTVVCALAKYANAIECGSPILSALYGRVVNTWDGNRKRAVVAGRTELLSYIHENEKELEYIASQAQRIYKAFKGGSKANFAQALWTIFYVYNPHDLGTIIRFVDEIVADLPSSPIIANGKATGMGKLINSAKQGVRVNPEYWIGLILAMYRYSSTNRLKITQKDISDAIPYFNLEIRRKQGITRISK